MSNHLLMVMPMEVRAMLSTIIKLKTAAIDKAAKRALSLENLPGIWQGALDMQPALENCLTGASEYITCDKHLNLHQIWPHFLSQAKVQGE